MIFSVNYTINDFWIMIPLRQSSGFCYFNFQVFPLNMTMKYGDLREWFETKHTIRSI